MAEIIGIYPQWGTAPEPLWREVLGSRLRALRADRDETLAQTAERAGISPQYLSEIERGRKEPSSEMIAALAGALGTTLAELTFAVTEDLRRLSGVGAGTITRAAGAPTISRAGAGRAPAPPVALAMVA
ncbi:MAG: helix-turn-helix transcriptional regulator [Trebonia sp.]|jgi:transcriptional regulator with XRE-family HTH domain